MMRTKRMIAKKVNMQKTLNLKKILTKLMRRSKSFYINRAFSESTLSDNNIPWVNCSICIKSQDYLYQFLSTIKCLEFYQNYTIYDQSRSLPLNMNYFIYFQIQKVKILAWSGDTTTTVDICNYI